MDKYKDIDIETVEKFFDAFPNEYMSLSIEEQKISGKIYILLSEGNPVSIDDIADSIGIEKDHVKSITDKWTGIHYDDGDIIAYRGLAIGKSAHTLKLDDQILYTWCAWDTLFIPQIIGKTTKVESIDPITKESISLTVSPES